MPIQSHLPSPPHPPQPASPPPARQVLPAHQGSPSGCCLPRPHLPDPPQPPASVVSLCTAPLVPCLPSSLCHLSPAMPTCHLQLARPVHVCCLPVHSFRVTPPRSRVPGRQSSLGQCVLRVLASPVAQRSARPCVQVQPVLPRKQCGTALRTAALGGCCRLRPRRAALRQSTGSRQLMHITHVMSYRKQA